MNYQRTQTITASQFDGVNPVEGMCNCQHEWIPPHIHVNADYTVSYPVDAGTWVTPDGEVYTDEEWQAAGWEEVGCPADEKALIENGVERYLRERAIVFEIRPEIDTETIYRRQITLERTDREGKSWAVRDGSLCLTKEGKWMHEPIPSNRTKAFLRKARFSSPVEAFQVFQEFQEAK